MEQPSTRTARQHKPEAGGQIRSFLENLTGPSRGTFHWLAEDALIASVGPDRLLHLTRADDDPPEPEDMARLTWDGEHYAISALGGHKIWLNGRLVGSASLMHGDMIEFGEHGPMSRYRLCSRSFSAHRPVEEILGDALAYARSSRRPLPARLTGALRDSGRRILWQTTLLFRLSVLLAFGLLAIFGYLLYQNDKSLQAALEQEMRRIEAVTMLLAQTRDEALSAADLNALQAELDSRVARNSERLGTLELRSDAPARIITASARSVAFVQGAFGLRHSESGKLLRHMVDAQGNKLLTPFGQPWIEPDGSGDPAEFQFNGTGFLLQGGQHLVTNRHVAQPWTTGDKEEAFRAAGLAPEMLRLVAYLPGREDPAEATLQGFSETADVAVLTLDGPMDDDRGLTLAETPPRAGDEVYLLGYPTGLKALLAQAGPDFLKSIGDRSDIDFWSLARLLATRDMIRPLASRGIIAQVSDNILAYDAETTVGGSGGPVLNSDGRVVAVNTAILPEFGGSNLGVPVAHLRALLEARNTQ